MSPVESNPLAILTFIAAPAILTNASSLLALGTSNRFARNVDRTRAIMKQMESDPPDSELSKLHRGLLVHLERRCTLLVTALSLFYFSVGCFAAGSLTSLVGAIVAPTQHPAILTATLAVALLAGAGGLTGLIAGGWLLVRETRLALAQIREEMQHHRDWLKSAQDSAATPAGSRD
jgi:hypothetical protein